MQTGRGLSLEQIRVFLEASESVEFEACDRTELYGWVEQTLREHNWGALKRSSRGLLRRYMAKMTGLSRAQLTRLIARYVGGDAVRPKSYRRHRFATQQLDRLRLDDCVEHERAARVSLAIVAVTAVHEHRLGEKLVANGAAGAAAGEFLFWHKKRDVNVTSYSSKAARRR